MPRPPTALYRMHRVLISTGIFACLVMTLWGVRRYRSFGELSALLVAVIGVIAACGLGFYLRYFNRRIAGPDAARRADRDR